MSNIEFRPSCQRHEGVVERVHAIEIKLNEIESGYRELEKLSDWKHEHHARAQWFYDHEGDLRQIVEMARWTLMARNVLAWLTGLVVAIGASLVWLKENLGRFVN